MPPDLSRLFVALADDLDAARIELEALGETLCTDISVALRFSGVLQAIDTIAQRQGAAAAVLRATDPRAAAAAVTLEALRHRLTPFLTA